MKDYSFYDHPNIGQLAKYIEEKRTAGSHRERTGRAAGASDRKHGLKPGIDRKLRVKLTAWQGRHPFKGAYAVTRDELDGSKPVLFWGTNSNRGMDLIRDAVSHLYHVVGFSSLYQIQKRQLRNYEQLCRSYAEDVQRIQPEGPCHIGGFCDGAKIMKRVAEILIEAGREVRQLIVHDYVMEDSFEAHVSML